MDTHALLEGTPNSTETLENGLAIKKKLNMYLSCNYSFWHLSQRDENLHSHKTCA